MEHRVNNTVTKQGKYIPGLDGIRALAIGLVLFSHSVIYDEFTQLHSVGVTAGSAGVVLFFVLSGYLITMLLLREESRTGGISLRLFYLRRAFRLLPALWLYLLVVGAIAVVGGLPHHPWHSFVSSLFYIRNLVGQGHETNHLWSLSIEAQFYLFWSLVLVALPKRNRTRLLIALVGLVSITVWRVYAAQTGMATVGALYTRSDFRFDAPLFGCLLALIEQVAPQTTRWLTSSGWRSALLGFIGVTGLIVWVGLDLGAAAYPGMDSTIVCLLSVVLILSQVGVQCRVSRVLAWSPLVIIGQMSYGLYLWQQLFLGSLVPGFDLIRVFPFGLLATIAATVVSYWCLERPLIQLKDRKFHQVVRESKPQVTAPRRS